MAWVYTENRAEEKTKFRQLLVKEPRRSETVLEKKNRYLHRS